VIARVAVVLGCVAAIAGVVALAGGDDRRRSPRVPEPAASAGAVGCAQALVDEPVDVPTSDDVVVGPLVLVGARSWARVPRAALAPTRRRDAVAKLPVVLPARATARLAVPRSQRRIAGLSYTAAAREVRRTSSAEPAVRFVACADRRTGWPGGVVLAGPACVRLAIRAGGRTVSRQLEFGRGACPS
jgi:hypothetical protein